MGNCVDCGEVLSLATRCDASTEAVERNTSNMSVGLNVALLRSLISS